ncbi:MAG: type II toxin-antitoxin system PemK/MazF family toxin [Chloroflexota bacterium]
MTAYIPKKGDFVVLTFDPQSGHEQKGRRPAIVISNHLFNKATRMAVVCPITNTKRNFPFHVPIPDDVDLTGLIMVEQIKSIDYRSRRVKFVAKAPQHIVDEILARLDTFIYQDAD